VRRDLQRLTSDEFDLLVVGGGIYGATAAWDATQRGLRVALIDKGDFGSATSFNNAKTVHGGVRSLQRGHLAEVREYLEERRALAFMLPHLVHPLPFLLPTYRTGLQHRWAVGAYFAAYDLLARGRGRLDDPAKQLPRSRLISRDECLRLHPALDPTDVTGGVVWYDAQFSNSDRAGLAFVASAAKAGCVTANYVEATSLLSAHDHVQGVMAMDHLRGAALPIRARTVLMAAGGWTDEWLARAVPRPRRLVPAWSVAMNLIVRPIAGTHAVGGKARGRLFFLAPWHDVTIAGTSHDPWSRRADELTPRRDDVARLLADLNTAFPGIDLTTRDVRLVHRGLLPATTATPDRVTLLRDSPVTDHAADGMSGLVSLVGVRYTTARRSAEKAVDLVGRILERALPPSASATTRLDGGGIERYDQYLRESIVAASWRPADDVVRLVRNYGTHHTLVLALMTARPELSTPLGAHCPVTRAEVVYAVTSEMAMRLSDVLLRRTDAGTRGHPGRDAVETAADLMAERLGWTPDRRADEMARFEHTYHTGL
jgi:glycerol-3-phosphate dehydrogenase